MPSPVKNIDILEEVILQNVRSVLTCYCVDPLNILNTKIIIQATVVTSAHFTVGIPLFSLDFFLKLKYQPCYNTYTWTLDYRYQSDFGEKICGVVFSLLFFGVLFDLCFFQCCCCCIVVIR